MSRVQNGLINKYLNFKNTLRLKRALPHIGFWSLFILFFLGLAIMKAESFKITMLSYLTFLPVQIIAAYTLAYYQVPYLLTKRRQYVLFTLTLFLTAYVFSAITRLASIYLIEPLFRDSFYQESIVEVLLDPLYLALGYFPSIYVIAFLFLTVKIIRDRLKEKQLIEIIRREKTETELKFLKAQIQPHFLFNTLNNIYALSLAKSDQTPEVILKLSKVLDYILYRCNEYRVPLKQEVSMIKDYISLEKIRHPEQVTINFSYNVFSETDVIAPLILISFIENAFKHFTKNKDNKKEVQINLTVENKTLVFQVSNTFAKKFSTKEETKAIEKIGHSNAKRQLNINYKNNFSLEEKHEDGWYKIVLRVNLNEKNK